MLVAVHLCRLKTQKNWRLHWFQFGVRHRNVDLALSALNRENVSKSQKNNWLLQTEIGQLFAHPSIKILTCVLVYFYILKLQTFQIGVRYRNVNLALSALIGESCLMSQKTHVTSNESETTFRPSITKKVYTCVFLYLCRLKVQKNCGSGCTHFNLFVFYNKEAVCKISSLQSSLNCRNLQRKEYLVLHKRYWYQTYSTTSKITLSYNG